MSQTTCFKSRTSRVCVGIEINCLRGKSHVLCVAWKRSGKRRLPLTSTSPPLVLSPYPRSWVHPAPPSCECPADTGNSCVHPGYAEFDPPADEIPGECAPTIRDWITLDPGMCGEGDGYPEEFWNCADIAISSDGGSGGRGTCMFALYFHEL